jgi:pimeloyl-ACP methyl ester carboxylesterase
MQGGTVDTCVAGDGRLEYQVRGSGEPLLMIHGAVVCDSFEATVDELGQSYELVTYRRRGYGGSSPPRKMGTIADQAADAVALLDHLGVDATHVAGHSYGGVVALQMALDAPRRVHSLGLLEPPLLAAPSGAEFGAGAAAVGQMIRSGDVEAALLAFLTLVGGDDPVRRVSKTLPSAWYGQALTDLPAMFGADGASLGPWKFTEAQARSISQPALLVLGNKTAPLLVESTEMLKEWLPNAELFVLDGATHLLQMENPDGIVRGLLAFLGRHPMSS